MFGETVRHVLHKVRKRWVIIGVAALALGGVATAHRVQAAADVSVNYVAGYSVAVWQRANGTQLTGKMLPTGSQWASYGAAKKGDNSFYLNVGGDQWLDAEYADLANENSNQALRGVVQIQYVPNYGIAVWSNPNNSRQLLKRPVLQHGSKWQVFQRSVVNGQTWYNVGGDQWIDGGYAKLISQEYRGSKSYIDGGPVATDNGGTTAPTTQKVTYRVVTRDQYGNIVSTQIYEGNVGDTITIGAISIDGYTLNDTNGKTIRLSADSSQNDVVFSYTHNNPTGGGSTGDYVPPVIQNVNYRIVAVDESGKAIPGYTVQSGSARPGTQVTAPTIVGYTVSGTKVINVPASGGIITFKYTKDAAAEVEYTFQATDTDGVVLPASDYTPGPAVKGVPGTTVDAPKIPGYTVSGDSTAKIPAGGGVIMFKYTKDSTEVEYTIRATDTDGAALPTTDYAPKSAKGEPGATITAPSIPGYTVSGPSEAAIPVGGGDVTFKYTKNDFYSSDEQTKIDSLRSGYAQLSNPTLNNSVFSVQPSLHPFNPGSTTLAFQKEVENGFNFLRNMWGLNPITVEPDISAIDQTASAFMAGYMSGLQHSVEKTQDYEKNYSQPSDVTDEQWAQVKQGLGNSNLYSMGSSDSLMDKLMGFLADDANLSGANAGHRLNMLMPGLTQSGVGVGLASGGQGTSNLSLDVWTSYPYTQEYTKDQGVMFYPGNSVFPIELLPNGAPISASSYGDVDVSTVTKVTIKDLTSGTSADLTGKQLLPGKMSFGHGKSSVTAVGFAFENKHQYQIIFYGSGLPDGSISTTFKTFSIAG